MNTAPFQQLQSFLAVARHRSFTGAARELGVTRAAVSQTEPIDRKRLEVKGPLVTREELERVFPGCGVDLLPLLVEAR